MPLHLLGKKSWNVYNPANIARVQQDEAEARHREEEQERQRRRDEESDRISALRGKRDGKQQHIESQGLPSKRRHDEGPDQDSALRRALKKRKLPGEDDTDREIRLAKTQVHALSTSEYRSMKARPDDQSITDSNGHISLVSPPTQSEPQTHKGQRTAENPTHFYLSEAAAYGSKASDTPWYSSAKGGSSIPAPGAWGSTSPRRKEREAARVSSNDPLAAMKRGVKQLRESEGERKAWKEQRERDLKEVEDLARDRDKRNSRKRRHGRQERGTVGLTKVGDDLESLDGFNLDEGDAKQQDQNRDGQVDDQTRHRHRRHHGEAHSERRRHGHHRHHHRQRHRSRSPPVP